MKVLIYLGHPAQYHFFKNIVKQLKKNNDVRYLIKTKEMLEALLDADGAEFKNILPEGRKSTRTGIVWGLAKRELRIFREVFKFRPDLIMGADPSIAHIGKLFQIPVLTVLEDDANVIYDLAKITYPFSTHIVAPDSCDCGKWNSKKISYAGYMKLAYLHPNHFQCPSKGKKKIAFIRLSSLEAFHDTKIRGFDEDVLKHMISLLAGDFKVLLSSENSMNPYFNQYLLKVSPQEIHNVMCKTSVLISDSQSMTMEAAMLGVPSIRYNDFAGRIGVLEELEHKYQLTKGIKPGNPERLYQALEELISIPDLAEEFQNRRLKMLKDKIDVTMFFVWLIENYPGSIKTMRENPEYQYNFSLKH